MIDLAATFGYHFDDAFLALLAGSRDLLCSDCGSHYSLALHHAGLWSYCEQIPPRQDYYPISAYSCLIDELHALIASSKPSSR